MFFRYLLIFVVFFMIANVVYSEEEPAPEQEQDDETDPRGLISGALIKNAVKILGKQFAGVAGHCLKEAAESCKKQLFPPKRFIKCARDYFKENQASCVVDEIIN